MLDAEIDPPRPLAEDGKPGCPVTVWDGPHSMRCSLGASVGRCAYHGPFATPIPPAKRDDWHEFDEDVNDASMCMCGVPALYHDSVFPPAEETPDA